MPDVVRLKPGYDTSSPIVSALRLSSGEERRISGDLDHFFRVIRASFSPEKAKEMTMLLKWTVFAAASEYNITSSPAFVCSETSEEPGPLYRISARFPGNAGGYEGNTYTMIRVEPRGVVRQVGMATLDKEGCAVPVLNLYRPYDSALILSSEAPLTLPLAALCRTGSQP